MNKLFFGILAILVAASIYTYLSEPEQQTGYPLVYWKSDANPQRYEQIELFSKWLEKTHPELRTTPGLPAFAVKLDSANNQSTLIQAVSGVGGDLIDFSVVPVFYAMGIVKDLTPYAKAGKFGLDTTYPGIAGLLSSYDGKQAGYPCNVAVGNFWINKKTFEKYGVKLPREEITLDEFERLGKEFVKKANATNPEKKVFFCPAASGFGANFNLINARSQGMDVFNETLTKSTVNDPRYIAPMKLLYKWTYTDKILPTAADVASQNVETGGYGGAAFTHFIKGTYGMIVTGRYALIRFRELPKEEQIPFHCVQYPQSGKFRNMIGTARITSMYTGTKDPDRTKYFFEFLASKDYNDYIIQGVDGLPPNPKFAMNNPEYLSPPKYPNEGNVHRNELKWAMELALPLSQTPYYSSTGRDWYIYALDKYLNDRATAEEAIKEAEDRINHSIQQTIRENPKLAKQYAEDIAIQKKIDDYKASGQKIPANWIKNPYYLKYYKSKNMLAEPERKK